MATEDPSEGDEVRPRRGAATDRRSVAEKRAAPHVTPRRRLRWRVRRTVHAPPSEVWRALTCPADWPTWGPTVRAASGPESIALGSRGTVRPVVGPAVPFRVDAFIPGRFWSWRVAGVSATGHTIAPVQERSGHPATEVEFDAPCWAPFYVPILRRGLRRLAALVESGPRRPSSAAPTSRSDQAEGGSP